LVSRLIEPLEPSFAKPFSSMADAPGPQVAFDVPACATFGKGFNDPNMNTTLNGAFTTSPAACQKTCRDTVFCMYFTWYEDTRGCWLQGNTSELTISRPDVYSGPANCSDITTTTPMPTTTENLTNATLVPVPVPAVTAAQDLASTDGGSTLPWYGWAGIVLAIVAILLLIFCCIFGGKGKGTGKSRKASIKAPKTSPDLEVPEPPAVDTQPLMGTEMQLEAQMAPEYSYSYSIPTPAPAAVPMTYSAAAPVVMPAPTYSVAAPAPTYSVAAPVTTYSVAPQTYSVAAPMAAPAYSVAAAPPTYSIAAPAATSPATSCPNCGNVYAADSLFCRMCGTKRDAGSGAQAASVSAGQYALS